MGRVSAGSPTPATWPCSTASTRAARRWPAPPGRWPSTAAWPWAEPRSRRWPRRGGWTRSRCCCRGWVRWRGWPPARTGPGSAFGDDEEQPRGESRRVEDGLGGDQRSQRSLLTEGATGVEVAVPLREVAAADLQSDAVPGQEGVGDGVQ